MPPTTTPLSRLLTLQSSELSKPILSKLSWLPDVVRIRGSIIPHIWGPVGCVTLWGVGVAVGSELYGEHLQLTNSVVPLLSVVVGLLLVFRNSSAYERYSEGRKDFTTLISNARNLTRTIWVYTSLPTAKDGEAPKMTKKRLTEAKKELIKLVVGFVVATKHHLRAEGGMHHNDLKGLLPPSLSRYEFTSLSTNSSTSSSRSSSPERTVPPPAPHPNKLKKPFFGRPVQALLDPADQERLIGLPPSPRHKNFPPPASPRASPSQPGTPRVVSPAAGSPGLGGFTTGTPRTATFERKPSRMSMGSPLRASAEYSHDEGEAEQGGVGRSQMAGEMVINPIGRPLSETSSAGGSRRHHHQPHPIRKDIRRRPTAVRIHSAPPPNTVISASPNEMDSIPSITVTPNGKDGDEERRPLLLKGIKAGIVPEERRVDGGTRTETGEGELLKIVELGLPLILAHEISRTLFKFRKMGCLEAVGPAGFNSMQASVQSMTDQLGAMERVVQTPLPYIFAVHLKQCISVYLMALPFTLVDIMGWRMVPLVTVVAFTLMGVEGIAAEVEQPFGNDPNDLNLDLYCAELRCEIEYIIDRLPQGDDEDEEDHLAGFADLEVRLKDDGAAGNDAGDGGDDGGH